MTMTNSAHSTTLLRHTDVVVVVFVVVVVVVVVIPVVVVVVPVFVVALRLHVKLFCIKSMFPKPI